MEKKYEDDELDQLINEQFIREAEIMKEEKLNRTKADEKAEHRWGENAKKINELDSGSNRPVHPVMKIWRITKPRMRK